jgi:outer membrane protein OmpA-like peptidoglycan-associated protein
MNNHSRWVVPRHAVDHINFSLFLRASVMTVLALNIISCAPAQRPDPAGVSLTTILVTATGNELEAHLSPAVRAELTTVALRGGSVAVLALPQTRLVPIPLTPRLPSGAVDHGPGRIARAEQLVAGIDAALAAAASTAAQLDLLTPLNTVVGLTASTGGPVRNRLIVISSGLSTVDPLNLNGIGWLQDPRQLAEDLRARHLLAPGWGHWHVTFAGLGRSAGRQTPLPEPARQQLVRYWLAICSAAGALSCDADSQPATTTTPARGHSVPTVEVPMIETRRGPHGSTETDLPEPVLFDRGSARLRPGASAALAPLAALARRQRSRVCITGMTDAVTGSAAFNLRLSAQRAQAVMRQLIELGVSQAQIICARGVGSSRNLPGADLTNGEPDLTKAAELRRVVLTFLPAPDRTPS